MRAYLFVVLEHANNIAVVKRLSAKPSASQAVFVPLAIDEPTATTNRQWLRDRQFVD